MRPAPDRAGAALFQGRRRGRGGVTLQVVILQPASATDRTDWPECRIYQ